jgi:hypothetical protein
MTATEDLMDREPRSFEDMAGQALREFALARSASVVKYGNLLTRFGKGEIQSTAFGEESLRLAVEEGTRYAQDAVKLGTAYLSFLSGLTRSADAQISSLRSSVGTAAVKARRAVPRKRRAKKSRAS